MGEDRIPDPGGNMDSQHPEDVKPGKTRKTSLDIYDVTTLARQSYEEEKISPLRQLRLMNESFVRKPTKSCNLSNNRKSDRRKSPNNHSGRYIELSENVRNMARRNSFDIVNSVEIEDKQQDHVMDLPTEVNTLVVQPGSDPVTGDLMLTNRLSLDQERSYYTGYSTPQEQMPLDNNIETKPQIVDYTETQCEEFTETPKKVRNIPGVLQIPDQNGRLKDEEVKQDDPVIYDMTSPKPVIDVKLLKDPSSRKYVPVKCPVVRISKSSDDFISNRRDSDIQQQKAVSESDRRWSRSDTGSEAYSSRSERSYASEPYSSRSDKSYSNSDKQSSVSEKYDHGSDMGSSRNDSSRNEQRPVIQRQTVIETKSKPESYGRRVSESAGDDFFVATMAAMGNILDKYETAHKDLDANRFSHNEFALSLSDEDLPLPDFPEDTYDGNDCADDSFPPAFTESPPRSPVDRELIPSPVSPTTRREEAMLTAGDLTRVELFYQGRGSHVVVCHCLAEFYEQNDLGQWIYLNRGVPVLILTTGQKKGQKRELKIVLAERGTGFRLWEDTINYLSNYTDESPKVHTMQLSRDHTKRVSFRMHSVAASTEFLGKFKEITSDPNDELWKVGKSKKSKKSRTFFLGKKGKKKLAKKDISQPCNFMHVTKVEPIDHSPEKDSESEEFRQRCNTSDW